MDRSVLEATGLDHLASDPRFQALSQASLAVSEGAMTSNAAETQAQVRELATRKRARRQGGQPSANLAPARAPEAMVEVQAALIVAVPTDLEQPMRPEPASTVPSDPA